MNLLGYIREKFAKEKYFKATRVPVRIRKSSILLKRSLRTSTVFTLNMTKIVPMADCSMLITHYAKQSVY